jgi:hypothetical protein
VTSFCEDGHANIIYEPINIHSRIYCTVDDDYRHVYRAYNV